MADTHLPYMVPTIPGSPGGVCNGGRVPHERCPECARFKVDGLATPCVVCGVATDSAILDRWYPNGTAPCCNACQKKIVETSRRLGLDQQPIVFFENTHARTLVDLESAMTENRRLLVILEKHGIDATGAKVAPETLELDDFDCIEDA